MQNLKISTNRPKKQISVRSTKVHVCNEINPFIIRLQLIFFVSIKYNYTYKYAFDMTLNTHTHKACHVYEKCRFRSFLFLFYTPENYSLMLQGKTTINELRIEDDTHNHKWIMCNCMPIATVIGNIFAFLLVIFRGFSSPFNH